jgi:hypothetical protein
MPTTNSLIRFDSVPTFGHNTIHKLPENVLELSKLAAQDYEDILQVCSSAGLQKTLTDQV